MQVFGNIAFNPDTEYNRHVNFHTFGAGILVLFRWDILWIFFLFSFCGLDTHGWLSCKLDEYIGNVHKWRPTIFILWHPIFEIILEQLTTLKLDIIDKRSLPIFIFCENYRTNGFQKVVRLLIITFFCYFVQYENFLTPVYQKDGTMRVLNFHYLLDKSQHSCSILTAELFCDWMKN